MIDLTPPGYDEPEPQYSEESEIWMEIERERALGITAGGSPPKEDNTDACDLGNIDVDVGIDDDKPRTIYDLEQDFDGYGKMIYVEKREEHSGKPAVWYKPVTNGKFSRAKRKGGTVFFSEVGELLNDEFLGS